MPLMLSKTYDALVAADAPEDKAPEAAEEITGYESRLSGMEADIGLIKIRLDSIEEKMALERDASANVRDTRRGRRVAAVAALGRERG